MSSDDLSPLRWNHGALSLTDQLPLPSKEIWIDCKSSDQVADAIARMVVRGAPAIGCAAAYGVALAAGKLAADGADAEIASRPLNDAMNAGSRTASWKVCTSSGKRYERPEPSE